MSKKVALITGAAGLLGSQHAEALLELGATVILTDINLDGISGTYKDLEKRFGVDKVIVERMDVSSRRNIIKVNNKLISQKMFVDVLINNAAIDPKYEGEGGLVNSSRFETFSIDSWDLQIKVGLTGAFLCSQIFGQKMALSGGGVIVNIASDLSVISPDQRLYEVEGLPSDKQPVKPITYSVIKTGLIGLTRYLATYWSEKGVRCNALSPGGVFNEQSKEFVARVSKLVPMNRMASLDEYKASIQFLCSDASKYMNGQNLVVDGGRSIW